ncbi:MAG: flagellar motor protein MotD, partial [Gammaproteobacteria bacterium]
MARRKRQEEHVNHERWLVSYADFITLLFAFFVVMYAVSSVNEGKYRVLSDTIEAAFKSKQGFEEETRAMQPIQIGEPGAQARNEPVDMEQPEASEAPPLLPDRRLLEQAAQVVDTMADELEQTLMPQIRDDLVDIKRNKLWLEVEIKSSLLFPSGSARISP